MDDPTDNNEPPAGISVWSPSLLKTFLKSIYTEWDKDTKKILVSLRFPKRVLKAATRKASFSIHIIGFLNNRMD